MTKRKTLPQITPPDPAQMMIVGVAPVSMGERLGWLAGQSADAAATPTAPARHRILEPDARPA